MAVTDIPCSAPSLYITTFETHLSAHYNIKYYFEKVIESTASLNKQCCDREVTFIAEVCNCSTERNIVTATQPHNRVKKN